MGEDQSHRAFRSRETVARTGQPRPAAPESDPLAELARLIGQTNPFGDAEQASARMAEQARAPAAPDVAAPDWGVRAPAPAPVAAAYEGAPQASGLHEAEPVPAYLIARARVDGLVYDAPEAGFGAAEQEVYDDLPPPPRRRMAVLVALAALVIGGSAVGYAYHAMFGVRGVQPPPVIHADNTPSKIVPAGNKDTGKLITERVGDAGEKIVAREEKPVDIADKIAASSAVFPPGPPAPAAAAPQASAGSGVIGTEPRKVHTIVIRPDGEQAATPAAPPPSVPPIAATSAAPPLAPAKTAAATPDSPFPPAPPATSMPPTHTAQPKPPAPEVRPVQPAHAVRARANAPLSLNPNAPAPARPETRVASVEPTSLAPAAAPAAKGGYAVQVSSQRTEQEAQAAFRALQGKYPKQLGGRRMFVHKVELGAKGTYYRALVGPFASASDATSLCTSLKSAGGSCFIQRN